MSDDEIILTGLCGAGGIYSGSEFSVDKGEEGNREPLVGRACEEPSVVRPGERTGGEPGCTTRTGTPEAGDIELCNGASCPPCTGGAGGV